MPKKIHNIDKVRASRDGHEYHEAWVARKALELLVPKGNLVAISMEGLSPIDQNKSISSTEEIADAAFYYGKKPTFEKSNKIKVAQLKYSIADKDIDFRNSHAKKTIKKFAKSYQNFIKKYGLNEANKKIEFELITNRPIYPSFIEAIKNIRNNKVSCGEVKKQVNQFKNATGLTEDQLVTFAKRFSIVGLGNSLSSVNKDLKATIVDWSAANDASARARLGALKQLVRDKAGGKGQKNNLIVRVDVLSTLEIQGEEELLPCPESLIDIGPLVKREQLPDVIKLIPKLNKPLLVHAEGGVGKTVFLSSMSRQLSQNGYETVFFDCFGGGAYRTPEDGRHLPKRGLIHIINTLAINGFCDPILPYNNDAESLFSAFRKRLNQCVTTLSRSTGKKLALFLDAIDNASMQAKHRSEDSFPSQLVESLSQNPIPGVKIIVSSRTHRIKELCIDDSSYKDYKLLPFTLNETKQYLKKRKKDLTEVETQVAQSRSRGNARILEYLVNGGEGLLEKSELNKSISLDTLLEQRISSALTEAKNRGYKKDEINSFLAGMAILSPPIPLKDYSLAQNIDLTAVKSFVADLYPLLEIIKYGTEPALIFKDEPTETYILEKYGNDKDTQKKIATNLFNIQDKSVYAAYALPRLLQLIGEGNKLFKLAFEERIPKSITSIVGKQNVQLARLKAAAFFFLENNDYNKLIHIFLKLSLIESSGQRGTDYVLNNPDLVITTNDIDANRRLFEAKTQWPGKRHAKLAIANSFSGDFEDANRHVIRLDEWVNHYFNKKENRSDRQKPGPTPSDIAAIPISLILLLALNLVLEKIKLLLYIQCFR